MGRTPPPSHCDVLITPLRRTPPRPVRLLSIPRKARQITSAGMRAGVALRPETPISGVLPLLKPRQLLHCVDVLAVQPGFGGQTFDSSVLKKVEELRSMFPDLDIQVRLLCSLLVRVRIILSHRE